MLVQANIIESVPEDTETSGYYLCYIQFIAVCITEASSAHWPNALSGHFVPQEIMVHGSSQSLTWAVFDLLL